MTNLILRDNTFEDLFDVRREFDKIFNRMLTARPWGKEGEAQLTGFNFVPAVETHLDKEGKKYVCKVALPGIEPKEVQINVQGNLLTITGERKIEKRTKEAEYFHEEFAYGRFEREIELPEGVNTEKVIAEFVNGVLEITAPVASVALPRKIEIKTTVPLVQQKAA
jgi:HSP20 family protein